MTNPLVSICCITYNHKDFICDTIEGFLLQKTTFPVEILVHDDASTDGTPEIVKSYASKYPNMIIPILQSENQWSKGIRPSPTYVWPRVRGKYIAICEGDDYWTDPDKLQKQVDFLEANDEYILCTHNHSTLYVEKSELTILGKYDHSFTYDLDFYLKNQITPTLTSCFRNIFSDYTYLIRENIFSDFFLFFELLKHGKGYYMVDNMATYRVHSKGVCSGLSDEQKILNHIIMFKHLSKNNSWISQIKPQIARFYLIHFNYNLRINRIKWPVWSDLLNFFRYEPAFFRLLTTFIFFVPVYLIRYWLPNIFSFKKSK
jgi:glycosyltransferase involved in cell wall biosynthesis